MQINIPTPSVKLPSVPKINIKTPAFVTKRRVLITAGTLLLLAVILASLALADRQRDTEARQRAEAAALMAKADAEQNKRLAALEAANGTLQVQANAKVAVCQYVTQLSTQVTTRRYVTVPVVCKQ